MYATVYAVRSFNFPKFVRMYGTCMRHDKSLFHTCIVPPLINLLLGYVTLIHYDLISWKLHMLFIQMAAPAGSESFLLMFRTPTLLWRVLHYAGYYEPPLYYWNEVRSFWYQAHHHRGKPARDPGHSPPALPMARRGRTSSCHHPTTPGARELELAIFVPGSEHRPALLSTISTTNLGKEPPSCLGKFFFLVVYYFL